MTAFFFSVIVPVFNRANTLGEALRSVLAQTDQDFEIIVVDDGSKDDPLSVVKALDDSRIRFVRQPNRGGGAARNTGIDLARGQFIAFLDSDDIFLPHHLESMRRLLDGTRDTVGYAQMLVDRGVGRTIVKPPRAIAAGEHMATYLLCERGFVPTITVVVPREHAKRVRYSETLRAAEDTDFAIRLFLSGCRFTMVSEPGAVWKDHYDPLRTSAGRDAARTERLRRWLDELAPIIPARAYHGCRGWAYAKHVARTDKRLALSLYLSALRHRAYRPSLAAIILLQIALPDKVYRALADGSIAWLGAGTSARARIRPANVRVS
jgi:glycosyltransferase involved in cell wall biosynthesis